MTAPMRTCAFVAVISLFSCGAPANGHKVTPIQTVIELLESLSVKVTEDGKKDAATYDKFACFCKEQADDKLYAIETSTKLIADLTATESKLDSEVTKLAGEISTHATSISGNEDSKKSEIASRAAEHAKFLEDKANLENGMAAVQNAIEVLEKAKGNMVDAKLTGSLMQKVSPVLAQFAPGQLSVLAHASAEPGDAAKYQYQGNELLAILANITATFKRTLKDMELTEFEAKKASDDTVLGLTNAIAFETKEKENKEAIEAAKSEELGKTREDKSAEEKAKTADEAFLKVVQDECEKKAVQWDKRSLLRANELTALSEATEELKTGALENFNANKKLVGFQQVAAKPVKKMTSFLQLRRARQDSRAAGAAVQKAQAFLASAATRLSSSALTSVAVKILVAKDHFVKVRQLIKDLVKKLEADAASEQTQKDYCDTEMKREIASRDLASAQIETATANIDKLDADNSKLKSEIATLSSEVSDLRKALADKTTLRNEESAENGVTVSMSEEGKQAVEDALKILTDFYTTAAGSLLQTKKYVPPNADRSGKSIRDYQDEIFTTEYKGAQTESTGIIGILQTILSDFERTTATTNQNEGDAQSDYDSYKTETEKDIKAKEDDIKAKQGDIASNDEKLVIEKGNLKTATELKDGALKSLEVLKKSCVDGEETYEERVKAREEEIAALKEAMDILIAWQDKA